MKTTVNLVVAMTFVIVLTVMLSCLGLVLSGGTPISIPCFSADSQGRIYVGHQRKIEVYDNGLLVRTINPKTSRGYMFTILENDTILLSTSTVVYSMDLMGNVISSWEDQGADTYNQLQYGKTRYESSRGDVYKLESVFGRTRIVKNGIDVVYSISLKSYVVKLLLIVSTVMFVLIIAVILYKKVPDIVRSGRK